MTRHTQPILTTLTAIAILALAVTNATANRLSVSNRNFRVTWTSIRLTNNINSETILCPATLEGSFHSSTIAKTVGALIGYITRASVISIACTGGHVTLRTETLPWHLRYRGYSGTLPNITSVTFGMSRFKDRIEAGGMTCEATTEDNNPAVGSIESRNGVAESLTPDSTAPIPLEGLCGFGGRGFLSERSQTLTLLGATTKITVTLI